MRNALESYHDAQQALDMAINMFSTGYLPLIQRSQAESLYWAICMKLQKLVKTMEEVPEDLQHLDESLSDTYFCNFSLFQSVPDSWAIKQLFPIMPIHRLNEQPTRHAVLGDITCDSDGKVDQFIDRRDVRRTLPLHAFNGSPYYLGIFLVGAYQEILGDLHNLYGDTHAVHVSLDADNRVVLDAVIKGDTVREVLSYVQFDGDALISKLRVDVETAVRDGRIDYEESGRLVQFFEDGLHGYTYLEERKSLTGDQERRRNSFKDRIAPDSPSLLSQSRLLDFVVDDLHVRAQPCFRRRRRTLILRRHRPALHDFLDALACLLRRAHGVGELAIERRVLLQLGHRHVHAVAGDDRVGDFAERAVRLRRSCRRSRGRCRRCSRRAAEDSCPRRCRRPTRRAAPETAPTRRRSCGRGRSSTVDLIGPLEERHAILERALRQPLALVLLEDVRRGGAPGLPSPVTAFIVFMFVAVFSWTTMSTVAGNSTLPLT